jgi:hypothetical protein
MFEGMVSCDYDVQKRLWVFSLIGLSFEMCSAFIFTLYATVSS